MLTLGIPVVNDKGVRVTLVADLLLVTTLTLHVGCS